MNRIMNYIQLMKPRPAVMASFTAVLGFWLGSQGPLDTVLLIHTFVGVLLVGCGAGALNQYFERDADARMKRTANRPLPGGRIPPPHALAFGLALSAGAVTYLVIFTNLLTASIAALTVASYVGIYTPLKRKSRISFWIGALAGALPPVMGWTAVRNSLDLEAGALFLILFVWQFPHFLAIAWRYREDYACGGFRFCAVHDASGRETSRQIVLYSAALLAVSLLPAIIGMSGPLYLAAALVSGLLFLAFSLYMTPARLDAFARRFVFASVVYLPVLAAFMMADRIQ